MFRNFISCFLVMFLTVSAWAGTPNFQVQPEPGAPSSERRFAQGHLEFSLMSGAFFSPFDTDFLPRTSTSFDYSQSEIRAGWMLNSPYEAGLFRGNFEVLLGLGGGAVLNGPGHALGN